LKLDVLDDFPPAWPPVPPLVLLQLMREQRAALDEYIEARV